MIAFSRQRHKLVNASRHRITVGEGVPVYGMWFDPGYGYHVDETRGIATGTSTHAMYMQCGLTSFYCIRDVFYPQHQRCWNHNTSRIQILAPF